MAFIDHAWLTGGALALFFFISRAYLMRIEPMAHIDKLIAKGDAMAKMRVSVIASIQRKLNR
jgi:hypothetical protein